ncbi:MAG: hypothetical protein Q8P50_09780 [Bacillota bacterium]|nr:hypothetical protein [Bacillota bacterium]
MRKDLPRIITTLSAVIVIFSVFTFVGQQLKLTATVDRWFQVSEATAFLIGAVNLTRIHGQHIQRRRAGYYNSIVLLICLWSFFALGLVVTNKSPVYRWIYDSTLVHMEATMFSVICFYIASAAYRAFRIRTREATVLLVVATIVMLGNVPIGDVIWSQLPVMKDWILRVPNSAAMRGINIGIYIGGFATALRILLGLERAHMGGAGA